MHLPSICTLRTQEPTYILQVMSNLLHHIPCVVLQQLDKQMHKMLLEKHKRCEEIKADQAALDKIDATITTQIQPCLARLEQDIRHKQALREQASQQLAGDMQRFKDMEREAAALISKARHANSKLMGKTAQAALQEARGFTATMPTTELIRGKKQGSSSSSAAGSPSSGSRAGSSKGLPNR
ncbi:hypothetical protein COO60DRAFT_58208 [Scenedesmus sp. NREL 46B-D3]|nr:hypothetical protein COO60DRAFT_58208 [Scenedesmus sp. NREL 46B-D3]